MSEKTLRICEKGHRYFKNSDCPTCPVCEAEKKPDDGFLELLSAPARRALLSKNISTVAQLSGYVEEEIKALHGIGNNAMKKMHQLLQEKGFDFKF